MRVKLKNIAEIYTGFTQRPPEKMVTHYNLKTIQTKDLTKDQILVTEDQFSHIEWCYDSTPQFLEHNSLIVAARGEVRAYVFKGQTSDQVVVSNQFLIINLSNKNVKPEFLAWYLNHAKEVRSYFEMHSRGSILMMLGIPTLKEASIIIPSLAEQEAILQMTDEARQEAEIFHKLIALKTEYNQLVIEKILKKAEQTA